MQVWNKHSEVLMFLLTNFLSIKATNNMVNSSYNEYLNLNYGGIVTNEW